MSAHPPPLFFARTHNVSIADDAIFSELPGQYIVHIVLGCLTWCLLSRQASFPFACTRLVRFDDIVASIHSRSGTYGKRAPAHQVQSWGSLLQSGPQQL